MSSGYDPIQDGTKKPPAYEATTSAAEKPEPGPSTALIDVINIQPQPQPWQSGLCDCSNPSTCK